MFPITAPLAWDRILGHLNLQETFHIQTTSPFDGCLGTGKVLQRSVTQFSHQENEANIHTRADGPGVRMSVGLELTVWPRLAPGSSLCLPIAEVTGRDHHIQKLWRF